MSDETLFSYRVPGAAIEVENRETGEAVVSVSAYGEGVTIGVPAHRLAEFCGALYQAAGQPVPDLPVIHDPALIDSFAAELSKAFDRHGNDFRAVADTLLYAKWRKS